MFRRHFVTVVAVAFAIAALAGGAQTVHAAYADPCSTPSGQEGLCIPIASCADIEQRLLAVNSGAERLTPDYENYLRQSNCGEFDGMIHVCCAASQVQHNSKVMALFQNASFSCGSLLISKIANGHEVHLSSRPWMALLGYRGNGEVTRYRCGGTLISERYVLTAAHCVHEREAELKEVRLGEHRISTEEDCRKHGRKTKCAPPVQNVGIEKHIIHEHYETKWNHNDIALLRLNRSVAFETHIKPICLPITDALKAQVESLTDLFVTGWGTTEKGSSSDVLLQAKVPLQPRSSCLKALGREIIQTQLCVGGDDLQDSCKGDSGGPLQAPASYLDEYKVRMVEFGIVSLGVDSCGRVSLPGIYTNVAEYVQWITDKMATNGI